MKKWLKKPLKQFKNQIKKAKNVSEVGNEVFINDKIKVLKDKFCLRSHGCQKEIVEFTDSTDTIC